MTPSLLVPHSWYAVCRTQQLRRQPLARLLANQPLVLFRDARGQAVTLLDRCPHRNAPLSAGWVRDDLLVCPYHGWQFDRLGRCQGIPGRCGETDHPARAVPGFATTEQGGLVWVYSTPGITPESAPPRIELFQRPGYVALVRDFVLEAALLDAVENFLDATHTHFVHAGLVRTSGVRRPVKARIRQAADWVEAKYIEEGTQSGWIARLFGWGITHSVGRFTLPGTVELEFWAGEQLKLLFTLYFTPETATSLRVLVVIVGKPAPLPLWLVRLPLEWLLWRVVAQDQRILAQQAANVRQFGGPHFTSTELDLLRPFLTRLLQEGQSPTDRFVEKEVTLLL